MTLAVVIVAVAVVLLTSLFKLEVFSDTVKKAIAAVVSLAAGVATAYYGGQFDGVTDVAQVVLVIYGLQQAIYNFLFDSGKPLNAIDQALESVGSGDNE
jgi:hypothetical protein